MKRLTLIAVLTLAACGAGTPLQDVTQAEARAPAHWGECPPDAQHGIGASLSEVFADHEWIELPNADAAKGLEEGMTQEADENSLRITVSGSVIRSGSSSPSTIDLAEPIIDPVREAVALGADLLIGFPPGVPDFLGGTSVVMALIEGSDEAVFLAPCTREGGSSVLARVATDFGAGSVVQFVRRVVDPTSPEAAFLAEATAPPPTLAWEQRDPDLRLISASIGDTPQEVIDQLMVVPVLVVVPIGWTDLAGGVCFKVSLGWSEGCLPTSPNPLVHVINIYAVPGEPVEVWLLGDPARLDQPIVQLATLDPDLIAEVAASLISPAPGGVPVDGKAFELTLTGDPVSIDQVKSAIAAGSTFTTVGIIPIEGAMDRMEATIPTAVPADGP